MCVFVCMYPCGVDVSNGHDIATLGKSEQEGWLDARWDLTTWHVA